MPSHSSLLADLPTGVPAHAAGAATSLLCAALPLVAAACWSTRSGRCADAQPDRMQAVIGPQVHPAVALEPEPEPEPAPATTARPAQPPTCSVTKTSIDGLWLFNDVVDETFQLQLVAFTESALAAGRAGKLPGRTFQAQSPKWAVRGQSREMLQYGVYTNSNRVQHSVEVAGMPEPLLKLRDVLVSKGVFDDSSLPDCCCINVYTPGMWLPPHVDNLEFGRPFCTVSLLSAQPVVFGDEISGANGDWSGELALTMPRGSALRVDGRAAGPTCKHAVPSPGSRRISMTFRRLSEESKQRGMEQRMSADATAKAKIERKRAKKRQARGNADR